jgi:hypothetical protein
MFDDVVVVHAWRRGGHGAVVTTIAGSGSYNFVDSNGTKAAFRNPLGVALDASGTFFIADYVNQRIRKLSASGGAPLIFCCTFNSCSDTVHGLLR